MNILGGKESEHDLAVRRCEENLKDLPLFSVSLSLSLSLSLQPEMAFFRESAVGGSFRQGSGCEASPRLSFLSKNILSVPSDCIFARAREDKFGSADEWWRHLHFIPSQPLNRKKEIGREKRHLHSKREIVECVQKDI